MAKPRGECPGELASRLRRVGGLDAGVGLGAGRFERVRCCAAGAARGVGAALLGLPVASVLRLYGSKWSRSPRGPRPGGGLGSGGSAGCGWDLACDCVAVAARRFGLREGLDRGGGSRFGWVCGVRLRSRLRLRRCGCESGWSPKGPRPQRWVSGRLGLRGAATILHLCGIHARCFLLVDRATRRKHRGDDEGPIGAGILPFRGPSHAKGESLPTRRTRGPGGRTILPSRAIPEGCCVHDGIRPRTRHPSTPHARTQNLASPEVALRVLARPRTRLPVEALSERRSTRTHSDAAAGRGPPGAAQPQGTTRPQQRSSKERPSRSNAAAGRAPAAPTQQRRRSRRPTVTRRRR